MASTVENMAAFLKRLEKVSAEFGLHVNEAKTKMIIINRPENNSPNEIEDIETVSHTCILLWKTQEATKRKYATGPN